MRISMLVTSLIICFVIAESYGDPLRASSGVSAGSTSKQSGATSKATSKQSGATSKGSTRPTQTIPRPLLCYDCGDLFRPCPQPFNPDSLNVKVVTALNGYCEKRSPVYGGSKLFIRGAAPPGRCMYRGCSSKYINNQWMSVCCCNTDRCNMGSQSAKMTWTFILISLAILFFQKL